MSMNRYSKALVIFAALVIWYALIGFWIAPALIRHFGEKQLQARFSPESSIAKVRINPFSGSFRVEDLKLSDAAGAWSVTWREAELNVSAATLFKFYPVVDEVRLDGADIRYEKRTSEAVEQNESKAEASGDWRDIVNELNLAEIPEVRVDLLEVSGGRVEFTDYTAAEIYKKTVDPINFTLRDFTTVIDGDTSMRFVAETDEGATLTWEGDFQSQPIRSAGTLSLSGLAVHDLSPYYTEWIRFHLNRAVFGFGFEYQFDLSNFEKLFEIQNGYVSFAEVVCEPMNQDGQLISIETVSAEGITFVFPEMLLEVADVQIANGETRVARDADGQINLAQLVALPSTPGDTSSAPEESTDENALPGLSYRIERIGVSDYRIVWEEMLNAGMANLTVDIPMMEITELSSDLDAPFRLTADYLIGESGSAHIEGTVVPQGPALDLSMQVGAVPLALLSPYTQNFGKTEVEAGTFDFEGRFQYEAGGAQTLSGDAAIHGISFLYDTNVEANWTELGVTGLQVNLSPFALAMESMSLEQPEVVYTKLAAPKDAVASVESEELTQTENPSTDTEAAQIRIDTFSISEGRVRFVDQSVEASPEIVMDAVSLNLKGLDLAGSAPADVALSTKINGSAFQVEGELNASQLKETTRLKASLSGLSLPAFSAYSGQAVGRRIANGLFNLDSDWTIEARQLKASNQIRIEQLEFGESVKSPDAISLPLDLAVTLLKGPDGVMDLSLPLSGDLSDPKVGIGQIVRTAIVGSITNVATAPFKMLSNLVGADEDLSVVGFEPGQSKLSPAMISRLNALAKALKARPGLRLKVTPQVSKSDEAELSEAKLRLDLLGDSDPSDEELYRRRLSKRYREAMKSAGTPDVLTKADDAAGLEKMLAALLPGVELSEVDRAGLATARAMVIRDHLLTAQGIQPEQLTMADPQYGASEPAAKFDLH